MKPILPSQSAAENPNSMDNTIASQLPRILEQYLEEAEAGRAPDRSAFLARYPEGGERLAECLDGLEMLQRVVPQISCRDEYCEPFPGRTSQLGEYRILRELGRGGMGVVYLAEQISLGRQVALKVLPLAAVMDPRQLQRFRNEVQAAALLQHQNIVPIYSVGHDKGVHYFVMQYVAGHTLAEMIAELRIHQEPATGSPSTVEADSEEPSCGDSPTVTPAKPASETLPVAGLSTRESIHRRNYFHQVVRLAIQAAEGLDHAHLRGVVHRDIKPSNLLLDATGNLWIADFGLARLENDVHITMSGDLLGTLRYMSPEQALSKRAVVDHRTDIYSLGLTLYEMLTLRPAHDSDTRDGMLRQIAESDPIRPRKWNRDVPRELETIVLKAIELKAEDRYETAGELADDLRRYLQDRPVLARPPTVLDRAARWSRRHRTWVAAGVVISFVVALGSITTTSLLWNARLKTDRALATAEANAERAQQASAETRAAVDFFIGGMLQSVKPTQNRGQELTVREVLANTDRNIEGQFVDQPLTEASVRALLAEAYEAIADFDAAERHYERAWQLRQQQLGDAAEKTLRTRRALGSLYLSAGRTDRAMLILREVYDASHQTLGAEHPLTMQAANSLAVLLWDDVAKWGEAGQLLRHNVDIAERVLGADHPETLRYQNNWAHFLSVQLGRLEEAKRIYQRVLERRQLRLGTDHPDTIASMGDLAGVLLDQGQLEAASELYQQALDLSQRVAGRDHPETINCMINLVGTFRAQQRWDEALELSEDAYQRSVRIRGADHQDTLAAGHNYAGVLFDTGQLQPARDLYREVRQTAIDKFGPSHRISIYAGLDLASVLREQDQFVEVAALYADLQDQLRALPPSSVRATALNDLAQGYAQLGVADTATARKWFQLACQIAEELVHEYPAESAYQVTLATVLDDSGIELRDSAAPEESLVILRRAREMWQALMDEQPLVSRHVTNWAKTSAEIAVLENAPEVIRSAIETLTGIVSRQPENEWAGCNLGVAYINLGRWLPDPGEAAAAFNEAIAVLQRLPETPEHRVALAEAYCNLGGRQMHLDPGKSLASFTAAVSVLEDVLRSDEGHAQARGRLLTAYTSRAVALHQLERYDEALADCEAALAVDPDHSPSHQCKGNILATQGSFLAAVPAFERAVELTPSDPGLRRALVFTYLNLQRYESAVRATRAAMEVDPEIVWDDVTEQDGAMHFVLVLAHHELGRPDEARQSLDRGRAWQEEKNLDHPSLIELRNRAAEAGESREHESR